jgi:hypothetical protein
MMYERIKEALKEKGELMIKTDSGEERELHLHNVEFLDEPIARVDADDEIHWMNLNKVERYWIHKDF